MSENGIKHLKEEEGLKLEAYDIGDGMITIGYGHAERKNKSKYKKGDKISLRKANMLFKSDLNHAERGVRRMFRQWKKEKKYIKITQHQFDALVSMAYNMGVGGIRRSKVVKLIKNNQLEKAGEKIKTTGLRSKFSGLKQRRSNESKLFLKNHSDDYINPPKIKED